MASKFALALALVFGSMSVAHASTGAAASADLCGQPTDGMELCLTLDAQTGRYAIDWSDPQFGDSRLPIRSRVTSPLDGSITYSGYINSSYPYQSYTLVVKVEDARDGVVPVVFTYAKTFERSEVYTFAMKRRN